MAPQAMLGLPHGPPQGLLDLDSMALACRELPREGAVEPREDMSGRQARHTRAVVCNWCVVGATVCVSLGGTIVHDIRIVQWHSHTTCVRHVLQIKKGNAMCWVCGLR